jgi:hypothetical protein
MPRDSEAEDQDQKRLPVTVYIYGGANGSGAAEIYDPRGAPPQASRPESIWLAPLDGNQPPRCVFDLPLVAAPSLDSMVHKHCGRVGDPVRLGLDSMATGTRNPFPFQPGNRFGDDPVHTAAKGVWSTPGKAVAGRAWLPDRTPHTRVQRQGRRRRLRLPASESVEMRRFGRDGLARAAVGWAGRH